MSILLYYYLADMYISFQSASTSGSQELIVSINPVHICVTGFFVVKLEIEEEPS